MAAVLIIGENRSIHGWASALEREGHTVETCAHSLDVHDRFQGDPIEIFICDVTHADWGEAMLMPQAKATWPECRTIAVASSYSFRSSAVFRMGLWTPDQLLIKPVNNRVLCATVSLLWAQIKTQAIRSMITNVPSFGFSKETAPGAQTNEVSGSSDLPGANRGPSAGHGN